MEYPMLIETEEGLEWRTIENPPILPAWSQRHRYFVWCEYCVCWHSHSDTNGPRQPHCFIDQSPYNSTGYVLQYAGLWRSPQRPRHREHETVFCTYCQQVAVSPRLEPALCRHCQMRTGRPVFMLAQPPLSPLRWQKLRFQIFKRDHYRCQLCGVAATDGPHVRLEVDHIIPRSRGGTDDPSNLLTMCFGCNRGKGTQEL